VALFGKILRNECDEEFRFIQQTVKETVFALLKAVLREKYPNTSENHLQKLHDSIVADSVDKWQWRKIIEKMYDEEDFRQLEAQINYRIGLQRDQVKYDPASQWAVDGLGCKEDESFRNA
jgi:Ca2+-binding EF-hand superfamily protein